MQSTFRLLLFCPNDSVVSNTPFPHKWAASWMATESAVISIQTASNEPRFMDYSLKPGVFAAPACEVWGAADLEADPAFIGQAGSPTIVAGLESAESRERKRERLEGTPQEIAAQLAEILIDQLNSR